MVKALIIGDPHFKISNIPDMILMTSRIINLVKESKPDFVVVLGDILDRHETIHVSPYFRAIEFLKQLKELVLTFVLIGNHDLKNNRQFFSEEHSLTALKLLPDIHVVDRTVEYIIKDQSFVFVPYVPPGRFLEALNYVDWADATCIFAHQEFLGAQMGAIQSTEGDLWPETYPYVISGHVHDYQQLQKNLLYVGTPIQHTYGDSGNKTVSIIDFDNYSQQRISLNMPLKQIIHLDCAEVNNYEPAEKSILKIFIHGTQGEIKAIRKHVKVIKWRNDGHKINYKEESVKVDLNNNNFAPSAKKTVKFSLALYNDIVSDPDLKDIYEELFGKVVVKRKIVLKVG